MKFALIGDPVEHSASPRLHRELLENAAIDGSYLSVRVPRGEAVAAIGRLRAENFAGCNVTYPLKEEAVAACDALAEEARRAGAVNTIYFGPQTLGTNTDGIGARSAIEALLDEPIALARIGVLGYGATARAILAELHDRDAYAFVWGRDRNAYALRAPATKPRLAFGQRPRDRRQYVAPGRGSAGRVARRLRAADVILDVNYGPRATLARAIGRDVVPGDAMLEAQARASFDFWLAHATQADTDW